MNLNVILAHESSNFSNSITSYSELSMYTKIRQKFIALNNLDDDPGDFSYIESLINEFINLESGDLIKKIVYKIPSSGVIDPIIFILTTHGYVYYFNVRENKIEKQNIPERFVDISTIWYTVFILTDNNQVYMYLSSKFGDPDPKLILNLKMVDGIKATKLLILSVKYNKVGLSFLVHREDKTVYMVNSNKTPIFLLSNIDDIERDDEDLDKFYTITDGVISEYKLLFSDDSIKLSQPDSIINQRDIIKEYESNDLDKYTEDEIVYYLRKTKLYKLDENISTKPLGIKGEILKIDSSKYHLLITYT